MINRYLSLGQIYSLSFLNDDFILNNLFQISNDIRLPNINFIVMSRDYIGLATKWLR